MAEDLIAQSESAFLRGDIDAAEALARTSLDEAGSRAAACHMLGVIALSRRRAEAALEWLERAIAAGFSNSTSLCNCGEAFRQLGRFGEAFVRLEEALKADNANINAHFNMGLVMRAQGKPPEAEHFFRNVLALEPGMSRAHFELAELYRQEGHWIESEREYRLSLGDPQSPPVDMGVRSPWLVRLASLLRERGRPEESIALLQAVIGKDGSATGAACLEVAMAEFELAHTAAAAHFAKAMELDPSLRRVQGGRVESVRYESLSRWCNAGHGKYTLMARAGFLRLPSPVILPPSSLGAAFGVPMTPELGCASLDRVEILPDDFAILTEGQLLIGGMVNAFQHYSRQSPYVRHESDDCRILLDIPGRLVAHDGDYITIGSPSDDYSWLFECLARLWVIEQMPALAGFPLLIPATLSQERRDMLADMGFPEVRITAIDSHAVARVDRLHVPSLMTVGDWVSPMALQFLRRCFGVSIAGQSRRRLYFSRASLDECRLANERALLPMLQKRGFEVIDVAGKSLKELLGLMQQAGVVLSMDDEHMASLVVAPQGALVGLVTAPGTFRPRAHFICAQLSHKLVYLAGETDYASHPVHALCDTLLPEAVLEDFLKRLDGESPPA